MPKDTLRQKVIYLKQMTEKLELMLKDGHDETNINAKHSIFDEKTPNIDVSL